PAGPRPAGPVAGPTGEAPWHASRARVTAATRIILDRVSRWRAPGRATDRPTQVAPGVVIADATDTERNRFTLRQRGRPAATVSSPSRVGGAKQLASAGLDLEREPLEQQDRLPVADLAGGDHAHRAIERDLDDVDPLAMVGGPAAGAGAGPVVI